MIISTHGIFASSIVNFTGLLDTYTGATAAYSLRKLRTAYTGYAIRVRRSSDSTSQDIGFNSLGGLDTSSLTSFVGSGNGFVSIWYDQSGLGVNLSQEASANQPKIVSSGVVYTLKSKPSIVFEGNQFLNTTGTVLSTGSGSYAIFGVNKHDNTNSRCIFYIGQSSPSNGVGLSKNSSGNPNHFWFANDFNSSQSYNNIDTLSIISYNQVNVFTKINGIEESTSLLGKNTLNPRLTTGYIPGFSNWFYGFESELIIYNSNQESNKSIIESNINSYYSIY